MIVIVTLAIGLRQSYRAWVSGDPLALNVIFVDVECHVATFIDTEETTVHVNKALSALYATFVTAGSSAGGAGDEAAELIVHFAAGIEPSKIELAAPSIDLHAIEGYEGVVRIDGHRCEGDKIRIVIDLHLELLVRSWDDRSTDAEGLAHTSRSGEEVNQRLGIAVFREFGELGGGWLVEREERRSAPSMRGHEDASEGLVEGEVVDADLVGAAGGLALGDGDEEDGELGGFGDHGSW
eukprot:CAMPEP_0167827498 /NCGR_PEP_ID=MMETSP0112_2-20121227/10737_1 /TAXON_ID=91324 /ORGANISM="Lotharella globosa, Strain CCCM811" /LENGTH=237 /DNA_ID=CAMNT_0007730287 /DNA_START=170 /DNA_END=882 /DNA_ORIENTATION=+